MAKNIKDGSDLIVNQNGDSVNKNVIAEGTEEAYLKYITNGGKNIGNTAAQNTQSNATASGTTNTPSSSKAVANRTLPAGVDPIAYRQDYDPRGIEGYDPEADLNPEYLAQMDMNTPISGGNQSFNQYGDDSSPEMQGTRGGLNPKYRGENTKNSDVAYNPDITTKDLNPYYVYGQTSKVYGTLHPGYISQRNDNIASALYNEGRRSKEDVAQFLSQQEGWMNSSEADRLNTIESVWKRIGDIAAKNEEKPEAPDLVEDTSGKLYGKNTAEEGNPKEGIDTLADANSVFKSMQEARKVKLQDFLNQDPSVIATCLNEGTITWDEQTWRDAEQYNPAFIAEVKAEQKKQIAQKNVQAISNGEEVSTVADNVDTNTQLTSYAVNNATSTTTATQLLKGIDSILESSDTAKSAQDLMGSIEKDMATLKNRLKNLRAEANAVFKGDVPEYMVNAYMSNKAQEIQNQLSILEDRYNAAYNRYKTEMSHAEWQAEYDLKKDSLALEEYKAKNPSSSTTTSKGTGKATMRTERNNNPTAMTTDVAKMLGGELGVDYEIGDAFTTADGKTLYTAKLIGDPIETTIRLIDRGIANGIDPFYRANGQPRWSYISKIGVTKDKWLKMSPSEKADVIGQMLKYEGGNMENMLYYVDNGGNGASGDTNYDLTYQSAYEKYLSGDYNKAWLEAQTKTMGIDETTFGRQAQNYKKDKDEGKLDVLDDVLINGGEWVRNDGKVFDFSKSSIYKSLSERDKIAVQQLLNNNISKQYINANRTKYDDPSGIFSAVGEIDPTWNDALFSNRQKAENRRKAGGQQGGWVSRNESAMATAKEIYELSFLLNDGEVKKAMSKYNLKTIRDLANAAELEMGNEKLSYLATLIYGLEEEAAGALKGGTAANSDKDVENMQRLLSLGLTEGQLKSAVTGIARLLYLKDESEVRDLSKLTYIKPESTWSQSVTDWMYNTLGMKDIPDTYDYTPGGVNPGGRAPTRNGGNQNVPDLKSWTQSKLKEKGTI